MLPLELSLISAPKGLPVKLQELRSFVEIDTGHRYPFKIGAVQFEDDYVRFALDIPLADGRHFYRLSVLIRKDGQIEITA
jgi:hypothetical protein